MSENLNNKILVIIDGHALLHRAYHALPPLTTSQGILINAAYGFFSVFLRMLQEIKPTHVVCCFDLAKPTFRHQKYKDYKAKRVKAPEDLYPQLEIIKDVLRVWQVPIFEQAGFEADDLIGTIATKLKNKPDVKVVIVTGDLDTLQLINDQVSVYTLGKGVNQTVVYNCEAVTKRFDLSPGQMIDYKALRGDPSDNIPGVLGIGEKTAISLLKEFGTLINLYEALENEQTKNLKPKLIEKLLVSRDQAFFSQELATINCRVPIKFNFSQATLADCDFNQVKQVFQKYEFFSLLKRLPSIPVATKTVDINLAEQTNQNKTLAQIETLYEQKILSPQIYQLEKDLVPIVERMQNWGIKLDVDYLADLSKKIDGELRQISTEIFRLMGKRFNLNSPAQLSEVLFSVLGMSTKGIHKTPGGAISTSASELAKLRDFHPAISLLEKYRELAKLKSTYTDNLPRLVNLKTGRLHAHFNQLGTTTGRMSCDKPNLQNIPIRTSWGLAMRRGFVAEAGYQLLSADYSQIELRIAAILSGDHKMLTAFKNDLDIHALTASQVFNIDLKDVSDNQRRIAKRLNFGILYGMGKRAFAISAGISTIEASNFIQEYFNDFQGVAEYLAKTKDLAREQGFVQTFFGRRRLLPQIHSSAPMLVQANERMAINMPIQGTAADLIKMAMVKVSPLLNNSVRLIGQIHDELLFEVKNDIIEKVKPEIRGCLELVYRFEIDLKTAISQGANWADVM